MWLQSVERVHGRLQGRLVSVDGAIEWIDIQSVWQHKLPIPLRTRASAVTNLHEWKVADTAEYLSLAGLDAGMAGGHTTYAFNYEDNLRIQLRRSPLSRAINPCPQSVVQAKCNGLRIPLPAIRAGLAACSRVRRGHHDSPCPPTPHETARSARGNLIFKTSVALLLPLSTRSLGFGIWQRSSRENRSSYAKNLCQCCHEGDAIQRNRAGFQLDLQLV